PYDAVFISGGVGECYYKKLENDVAFGDVGPALARALRKDARFSSLNVLKPDNTLRATVIGAGMHTLSLSGSTIWLSYDKLPIRNVPVLHVANDVADEIDNIVHSWQDAALVRDLDINHDSYVI